jgi:hypothetical protein
LKKDEAERRIAAAADPFPGVAVTIPEKAQSLATTLKSDLSSGIDRVMSSIHLAVEDALKARFQGELTEMNLARDAYQREIKDAFAALEGVSEALNESQDRVVHIESAFAAALTARDVNEALRAASAQQQEGTLARLREVENELKSEALSCAGLRVELVRAQLARETAEQGCREAVASLDDARLTICENAELLASLKEANCRQAEALERNDCEIDWLRMGPDAAQKATPKCASTTDGQLLTPETSPVPAVVEPTSSRVVHDLRRRRKIDQGIGLSGARPSDQSDVVSSPYAQQPPSSATAGRP